VREKAYKWLAKEVLPQLLPKRAAQLAPALADPSGVAVQGIRSEPQANEQYAALALLQAALALCPPARLNDRCWASADMLGHLSDPFAYEAHAYLALWAVGHLLLHSSRQIVTHQWMRVRAGAVCQRIVKGLEATLVPSHTPAAGLRSERMRLLAKLLQECCLSKTSGKSSSEGVFASVLETLGLVLEAAPQASRRCLMLVNNTSCLLARWHIGGSGQYGRMHMRRKLLAAVFTACCMPASVH
jgi:hypothetical protein